MPVAAFRWLWLALALKAFGYFFMKPSRVFVALNQTLEVSRWGQSREKEGGRYNEGWQQK